MHQTRTLPRNKPNYDLRCPRPTSTPTSPTSWPPFSFRDMREHARLRRKTNKDCSQEIQTRTQANNHTSHSRHTSKHRHLMGAVKEDNSNDHLYERAPNTVVSRVGKIQCSISVTSRSSTTSLTPSSKSTTPSTKSPQWILALDPAAVHRLLAVWCTKDSQHRPPPSHIAVATHMPLATCIMLPHELAVLRSS